MPKIVYRRLQFINKAITIKFFLISKKVKLLIASNVILFFIFALQHNCYRKVITNIT